MTYWKQKKVLVTGGAGFIGCHVVRHLVAEGAGVSVLDNLQSGTWAALQEIIADVGNCRIDVSPDITDHRSVLHQPEGDIRCIQADVRDAGVVRLVVKELAPDVILHLAANASVPGSVEDPAYDFNSNTGGTFNVLEAVRLEKPDTRVVVVSSGAVYGEPVSFPITEESPLVPISPYGASKMAAETEARMFHVVYKIPVVTARFFNTYGPGMPRFVVLDFLKKLKKNQDCLEILGTGRQMRDFTYVDDTVRGLLVLAEHGLAGQAYNIASGRSYTVTELARVVIDVLGLTGRTRLSFTGESWVGDAQRWEVSIDKVVTLGYSPLVPLQEGVGKVAKWFSRSEDM